MPEVYSKRLGAISEEQFAAATKRLGVGTFLRAAPITSGLFGQNVFLTTSEGEFVLRGAPHWVDFSEQGPWKFERNDLWQFSKEICFAKLLHEHTDAPVAWPQLLDRESDIFGWPYIIMPRMPGTCFDDRKMPKELSPEQRRSAARAMGSMLVRLQKLAWPFAGDVDLSFELVPYPDGHTAHVVRQTAKFADNARANGGLSARDDAWIEQIGEAARTVSAARPNLYVHGDYKPGNLTLSTGGDEMTVTGIFDLHESRIGDGASDICRQTCAYLDVDPEMAREFVTSYRSQAGDDPTIRDRMPLYVINDRMKFWEHFTRPPDVAPWLKGKTFRDWAGRYVDDILELL